MFSRWNVIMIWVGGQEVEKEDKSVRRWALCLSELQNLMVEVAVNTEYSVVGGSVGCGSAAVRLNRISG